MHDHADHIGLTGAALSPEERPGPGAGTALSSVGTVAPGSSHHAPCATKPGLATSADILGAEVVAWYEALPPDVQPRTLIARYPRIANALCAVSRDRRLFDDYIGALLTDERGQRTGFPAGVLRDLLAVRMHVHALHADGFGTSEVPARR